MKKELTPSGNFLTEEESIELQKYKKEKNLFIVMWVIVIFFLIPIYGINLYRTQPMIFFILIFLTFLSLAVQIFLFKSIEFIKKYILSVINNIIFFTMNLTVVSILIVNSLSIWPIASISPSIVLIVLFFLSLLIGIFFNINTSFENLNKWLTRDLVYSDEFVYNIFLKKKYKANPYHYIAGIAIIFLFPVSIEVFKRIFQIDLLEIISPYILLIIALILNFFIGKIISIYLFINNYEKKNNIIFYTGLIKFVRLENEINEWRNSWKSLKPIKIKSIFFDGNIFC